MENAARSAFPCSRTGVIRHGSATRWKPEWEARFEPRSYGFRPGRGCADAIAALFTTLKGRSKRVWIVDADLSAAFDRIDHPRLLDALGSFPARDMIAGWLKAGVVEDGTVHADRGGNSPGRRDQPVDDERGAPWAGGGRRGPVPPRASTPGTPGPARPIVVRYADDLVACCHSRQQAEQVKAQLAAWLAPRGLVFNEDKTKIVHLTEGFDFLGFNVRRYQNGKLLIKPSSAAVRRLRNRLAAEMRALRGSNAAAVIAALNPIIRGWAAYYRGVVSSKIFGDAGQLHVEAHLPVGQAHPPREAEEVGRPPLLRQVQQVQERPMGVRDRAGADERGNVPHLVKFSWTPIVRHQMVAGGASPDDPDLAGYWATRRQRVKPPLDGYNLRLLTRQDGTLSALRETTCSPPTSPPVPRGMGTMVAEHRPQGDRRRLSRPPRTGTARRTGTEPAWCTPPAAASFRPANAGTQHHNPQRPRGLLEPCAWTSAHARF